MTTMRAMNFGRLWKWAEVFLVAPTAIIATAFTVALYERGAIAEIEGWRIMLLIAILAYVFLIPRFYVLMRDAGHTKAENVK
jgi:hypothetical protein